MRVYSMLSLTLLTAMLSNSLIASAKGGAPQPPAAAAQQEQQRAHQAQQAQQQQQRAQQEAMQQMQAKQQQERVQQEASMRAQEEQARKNQMQAVQQQQEQARKMQEQQQQVQQEQARKMQEQQQQVQQEQARKMQEQQQQVQQEQARKMQEQQQQVQQEQARKMQEQQQQVQQEQARKMQGQQQQVQQEQARNSHKENFARSETPAQRPQGNAAFEGRSAQAGGGGGNRPFKARPLSVTTVPIEKAVPQPVLEPNAHPGEQDHSKAVTANLQRHLLAVPGAQAPQNRESMINSGRNNYFNNYSTVVNNRRININRQNTNVSYFQPNQYPTWYQPQPNWNMSNGFTLGNDIHCGLDWLQWGWHPYYGPPPEGFVCADDYFPTPWVFIPAYGVWRQPGEFDYSPAGPPYDYTGPISVEVLEPRHVHTRDPYSGWVNDRVINVVYFYDAFYYPDADRWGYMNRHGYFIWLNLDQDES